ncbi:MAG: NAD(P)H-hydrate dehydratase [Patescibacteria group bacterium]
MDLSNIYCARPTNVHKGNFGSVLVVGGSKLYSGSATLAAIGAVRSGADLVTVAAPARAADVASHTLCDLITYPLRGDYLKNTHVADILDLLLVRKINAVVIGPGMGRHRLTVGALQKLITKINLPMVLDADALFAISMNPKITLSKQLILTPHAGELAILMKLHKLSENFDVRLSTAKDAAKKYGAVVLLKGNVDIITDGTNTITNNTGSPYMTKGGFGDVLAGICATLLARGVGLFEAANVGAYISGRAGEMAAQHYGEGLAASDVFNFIPRVIHAS